MKRYIITFILLLTLILPLSAKSNEIIKNDFLGIGFIGLPDDFLYPSYLADPLAVNSQITYREYSIDEVHPNSDGTEGHFDITIGTRYNFFRFSPNDNPNLGIEMDWGMALTTFMNTHGTDFLDVDGIYYFSLAVKPNDWSAYRFARHHICSHQGDQLDEKQDGSEYIDFDINVMVNSGTYIRDDYMISMMFEPLHFLNQWFPYFSKTLRLYADYNFFIPGYDLLGRRANEPSDHAYQWYQYGAEFEVPLKKKDLGSLFVAGQVSHWQESAYAPNYSLQAGYIFIPGKSGQRMKFAASYYDGQSLMNNFRSTRSKYMGFVFTIDK